jgi:hypothetical protein
MLSHVALVRTNVSEERIASIIRVMKRNTTRATQRHLREDGILHGHFRENHKSYIALTGWGL